MNPEPAGPVDVELHRFDPSGEIPNNPHLPLVVMRAALPGAADAMAPEFERRFEANGWRGSWRNGVYSYAHFHSGTHEVLGCYAGSASVRLGGDGGVDVQVEAGDVIVLPAGTGHQNLGASPDFGVVGAYPECGHYDLLRPGEEGLEEVLRRVRAVPVPEADPVFGAGGPLREAWGGGGSAGGDPQS